MYYHVRLDSVGNLTYYSWNYSHDGIIENLIIPFLNKQFWKASGGRLVNLGSCPSITIYSSNDKLPKTESNKIPSKLINGTLKICTENIVNEARVHVSTSDFKSLLQQALSRPKDQVFIIMKFGDDVLDSAYKEVIKPVFKDFGLNPIRIDEIQDSGVITDQILQTIAESKYIYSDLSGQRQNCYYETGFAHALGKEIILAIMKDEPIHFDLSTRRFIIWKTESNLRSQLIARLDTLSGQASQDTNLG